jgi:hypothetical protein
VIPPAFRERRLYAKKKVTTQVDRLKVDRLKVNGKNINISRRQTQTFSSADLAEENRRALRAGEMSRARRSAGELRMVFNRDWSHETKQ